MLTLDVRVHSASVNYGNSCVNDQVNAYLATGALAATDRTCH